MLPFRFCFTDQHYDNIIKILYLSFLLGTDEHMLGLIFDSAVLHSLNADKTTEEEMLALL